MNFLSSDDHFSAFLKLSITSSVVKDFDETIKNVF